MLLHSPEQLAQETRIDVQLARDFPGRDVGVVRDLPQAPDFPTI
jgi:hypothetical protein